MKTPLSFKFENDTAFFIHLIYAMLSLCVVVRAFIDTDNSSRL